MRLEYFLRGLNYPCTIEWYYKTIDDKHIKDIREFTLPGVHSFISLLNSDYFVYEFEQVSSTHYKIAIV